MAKQKSATKSGTTRRPQSARAEIPIAEYATRRDAALKALGKAIGVVFAGDHADHLHGDFRPHPHFEYLTGVTDEPSAILVLDPTAPSARQAMLFLRPLDPELEQWDGLRSGLGSALRQATGIQTIQRTRQLGRALNDSARRAKRLACLHPLAYHDQPVSPDLALFRKLAERIPGVTIEDRTEILAELRSTKSRHEVAMIQRAVDITATGFAAACGALRPGANEFAVQEAVEHAYRTNGSRGPAFGTIVGSGINSTVLHYRANDRVVEDGEIVCIDSGAAFGGYGADVTRTLPASGTFSARQREVYEVVLRALKAATDKVRPGAAIAELDKAARDVITKAGFGDAFIHSIGHHLGLETHDITPAGKLKAGAVITIEPGIYLPDERIGVRIEDDVLVTRDGAKVLSARIPKTVAAIEKAMAAAR